MKYFLCVLLCIIISSISAHSSSSDQEHQRLVGKGRLSKLFFNIYDIALYSSGENFSFEQPFSLKITYLTDVPASDITDSTMDEIQALGFTNKQILTRWQAQLAQIFPDVVKGDRLAASVDNNQHTSFYHNEKFIGKIVDTSFAKWFFGIWLAENTTLPQLRMQLLGK